MIDVKTCARGRPPVQVAAVGLDPAKSVFRRSRYGFSSTRLIEHYSAVVGDEAECVRSKPGAVSVRGGDVWRDMTDGSGRDGAGAADPSTHSPSW